MAVLDESEIELKIGELTDYCLTIGENPLLALNFIPQKLKKQVEPLLRHYKETVPHLDKLEYYHPSSNETGYLIREVQKKITSLQKKALTNFDYYVQEISSQCPALLDFMELNDPDEKGLIRVTSRLQPKEQWFELNGRPIFIAQTIPGSLNSSLQLSDILTQLSLDKELEVSFRPDCFRFPKAQSGIRREYADWYGRPFDLKWVKELTEDEVAENGPNRTGALSDGHCTQFLWSPRKDGSIHLSIEELPHKIEGVIPESEDKIFARFVHGILNPETEEFEHLDGALHIYERSAYMDRLQQNLASYSKCYYKVKIFRIDGGICLEPFQYVIGGFYKWNWMPMEYFQPSE